MLLNWIFDIALQNLKLFVKNNGIDFFAFWSMAPKKETFWGPGHADFRWEKETRIGKYIA